MKRTSAHPSKWSPEHASRYYPAFLALRHRKAVVCGGGTVAGRKVAMLLKAGADITVVSPEINAYIRRQKDRGRIAHIRRSYRKGDLKNAFLVIAATDSPEVNERISRDAPCLVNVVDTPHLCNFIVPSTIHRGSLTVAISTGGDSPALARSMRKELEQGLGPEFSRYLALLRSIRAEAMRSIDDCQRRRKLLLGIASQDIIRMLREKGYERTKRELKSRLKRAKTG